MAASSEDVCRDGTCHADESSGSRAWDAGIVLVDEDFQDGEAQGWFYDPASWEIVEDGGSLVWNNTGPAWATIGSNTWQDYVLFLGLRRVNSDANVYVRADGDDGYGLRAEGTPVVLWTECSGAPQDLAGGSVDVGTTWHDYRTDVVGRHITATVDGTVVLTYQDGPLASLRGGIALEAFASEDAHFDDILIYGTTPQCYNGIQDREEIGVDCGGRCPIQDCCANRAWDAALGEGGVDCGGPCALTCRPAQRLDRWTQTNGP